MFLRAFKKRLTDCLTQTWHNDIDSSSRCDTYRCNKTLISPEEFLSIDINYVKRRDMARFRCSNHTLNIEQGRHFNITREDRLCIYCLALYDNLILENEYHAVFEYFQYEEIRVNHLFNWYSGRREIMLHSAI